MSVANAKKLTPAMVEALTKAKVAVRQPSEETWVDAQIHDLYDLGSEKGTDIPVQSLEVITPDSKEIKKFAIKGKDAIELVFGNPKNGKLGKVTYVGDRPISLKIPLVEPNKDDQYWFSIKKTN